MRSLAMPRYYFHIREGEELERDPDGQDLPNLQAAEEEARIYASAILQEADTGGPLPSIEVADMTGHVLLHFGCETLKRGGT